MSTNDCDDEQSYRIGLFANLSVRVLPGRTRDQLRPANDGEVFRQFLVHPTIQRLNQRAEEQFRAVE